MLTDGVYNYQYDDEGNRTRRVEIATGKVTEYVWDYRNRLSSVLFKDAGGVVTKTIAYTYDVNNQRIGKSIDGVTTERFVYDRNQISLVFDGAGVQTHRYLYGTGVDTVLADERGGSVVWALADNLGTVRDVIDNNGNVLQHLNYDSFGNYLRPTTYDLPLIRYGFTGRERDEETGLDYYRARYYDSANGRFISEDPLGFGASDANLYRYVGNSPTNFVDPSGEFQEPIGREEELWNSRPGQNDPSIKFPPSISIPRNVPKTIPIAPRGRSNPGFNPGRYRQPSDLGSPSGFPAGFIKTPSTEEQQDILSNRRAKITQYKDRLQLDRRSVPDPNKCDRFCYTFELPNHLGGPSGSKGSSYATHVSGSKGDFLIFTQKGDFAFFDGLVTPRGALSRFGVTLYRHVIEAKAWDYGMYERRWKKAALIKLKADANHDLSVATQCKYTYSVVTSSPTLTRHFRTASPGINIYNIPFPRTQQQIDTGQGIVDL